MIFKVWTDKELKEAGGGGNEQVRSWSSLKGSFNTRGWFSIPVEQHGLALDIKKKSAE